MARMLCSLPKKCSRQLVSSNTLVQVCITAATGCMCHQRRWYRSALYKCPDRLQGSAYTLVQVGLAPTGYKGQQIQSTGVNCITALTCYRGHQIHWYRWVLHRQVTRVSRYSQQVCALTGYRGHQIPWYRWVLHRQVTGVIRYIGIGTDRLGSSGGSCTDRLQGSSDTDTLVSDTLVGLALTGYRGQQIHWYRWVLHQQVTGVSRYIGISGSCTNRLQGSTDTLV